MRLKSVLLVGVLFLVAVCLPSSSAQARVRVGVVVVLRSMLPIHIYIPAIIIRGTIPTRTHTRTGHMQSPRQFMHCPPLPTIIRNHFYAPSVQQDYYSGPSLAPPPAATIAPSTVVPPPAPQPMMPAPDAVPLAPSSPAGSEL